MMNKIVLFDGVCKLCNAWCRFIIKHDKKHQFNFVSMQSEHGQKTLLKLGQATKHFETMILIDNNHAYFKSTAFLKIVRQLPFPSKFLFVFNLIPLFIRDFIYTKIARNRYRLFGRFEQCQLLPDNKNNQQ